MPAHPPTPPASPPPDRATPSDPPSPAAGAGGGLPKAYRPLDHERAVTQRWDDAKVFHADPARVLSGEKKPYAIFIPPPNVTAALHLGHALNNTLQDVLARAHRMKGFETLWMPGTDHAGIATQAVVEKRVLKEEGKRRKDFTREEFIAKIQAFKDEYEATITEQLKEMGCSCDWDRQRFTMDDQCAAAVREAFFRLFRDGLIYRGKRLVNWDPALQTAVADDECYDAEIDGSFYYLRYPLVKGSDGNRAATPVTWGDLAARGYPGAAEHPASEPAWVTVATTRPETYLGDAAIGVSPKDPRAKSLEGLCVQLPIVGRIVPIIADDYVVLPAALWADQEAAKSDAKAQFATGFLKVTPAHDQNDYDLYQRHKATVDTNSGGTGLINVMAPDGSISDKHGWSDIGEAGLFIGLTREDARKKVVAEFKACGLLEGTKPYRHSVKHSDRSKAIVEPYLSDQWYVKVTDSQMAESANAALVKEQRTTGVGSSENPGDLEFYPARYAKTYEQWHDNIRDWCISRQLWWGHRIPVWSLAPFYDYDGNPQGVPEKIQAAMKSAERLFFSLGQQVSVRAAGSDESQWIELCTGSSHMATIIALLDHLASPAGDNEEDVKLALSQLPFAIPDLPGAASAVKDFVGRFDSCSGSLNGFEQDPDVLDTWFSSALWPLSTLGWPDPAAHNAADNKGLLEAFNPSSVLCTAREIITLWVSRMVMFNRYFGTDTASGPVDTGRRGNHGHGPIPFKDVFIHAMIQDGEGRKMSKSLGNGVDPRDIIESHGADAMRFTLVQMTTQTQDVRMPVEKDATTGKNTSPKFDLGRNYCNKLWNTTRFVLEKLGKSDGATKARSDEGAIEGKSIQRNDLSLLDRWMLSRLASTVKAVDSAIAHYEFSDYAEAMYRLLWWDLCDWYLEGVKPSVEESPVQRAVLAHALETIVRLLHPITPFITEAIWEHLRTLETAPIAGVTLGPSGPSGLLCTAGWPQISESWIDADAETRFGSVRELVESIRNLRSQHQVAPKRRITLHIRPNGSAAAALASAPGLIETLCGVESITTTAPAATEAAPAVAFRALGEELHLTNLADAVDAGAEKDRITKLIGDLEKTESTMEKRLGNEGYIAKAPPKLVEESKGQLAKVKEELAALRAKLKAL